MHNCPGKRRLRQPTVASAHRLTGLRSLDAGLQSATTLHSDLQMRAAADLLPLPLWGWPLGAGLPSRLLGGRPFPLYEGRVTEVAVIITAGLLLTLICKYQAQMSLSGLSAVAGLVQSGYRLCAGRKCRATCKHGNLLCKLSLSSSCSLTKLRKCSLRRLEETSRRTLKCSQCTACGYHMKQSSTNA